VRLIPAENKRTQLCLQTELAEEKSHRSYCSEQNKCASEKQKVVTHNVIKMLCMQARHWPEIC